MKTINTADATGAALDWLVAKCEGELDAEVLVGKVTTKAVIVDDAGGPFSFRIGSYFTPSTDWSQGGPIIEREAIDTESIAGGSDGWMATIYLTNEMVRQYGPTPLIAAMRCFVASKLGDTVEVPEELL